MTDKIDQLLWFAIWVGSGASFVAVQFFDWLPDPKYTAATAFLAIQFAAGGRMILFRKADKA